MLKDTSYKHKSKENKSGYIISDKIEFKAKKIARDCEGHYEMVYPLPFHPGPGRMASIKKHGEKKGRSAINEVVIREYIISIHKHMHGVSFKKRASWALKEIWKFAMKEMGTPDVRIDTSLNKAAWAKE